MSRSLHTQKLEIRARRRLVRPHSKRRDECAYLSGRNPGKTAVSSLSVPITVQRPLPGTVHMLTPGDIRAFLEFLGPVARYGLKAIRLRQDNALRNEGMVFAEYLLSGEILLFAVPALRWRLPFLLHASDTAAFESYGAQIDTELERDRTTVRWDAAGLARFALVEVVAHELGHHQLQHNKGKRKRIICRRADHEKRADLESRRVKGLVTRRAGRT